MCLIVDWASRFWMKLLTIIYLLFISFILQFLAIIVIAFLAQVTVGVLAYIHRNQVSTYGNDWCRWFSMHDGIPVSVTSEKHSAWIVHSFVSWPGAYNVEREYFDINDNSWDISFS